MRIRACSTVPLFFLAYAAAPAASFLRPAAVLDICSVAGMVTAAAGALLLHAPQSQYDSIWVSGFAMQSSPSHGGAPAVPPESMLTFVVMAARIYGSYGSSVLKLKVGIQKKC